MDTKESSAKESGSQEPKPAKRKTRKRRRKPTFREELRWWSTKVFLPIIVTALGAGGIWTLLANRNAVDNPRISNAGAQRVSIQDEFYHIGDVEYVTIVQDGQIINKVYFSHRSPQANPFTKDFSLKKVPSSAVLHLTARSIDPDEKKSPIKIFINGKFLDFLNRYVSEETMEEKVVTIPFDISLFHEGINNIQIFVESTSLDVQANIDDIEFWNMYLEIIP